MHCTLLHLHTLVLIYYKTPTRDVVIASCEPLRCILFSLKVETRNDVTRDLTEQYKLENICCGCSFALILHVQIVHQHVEVGRYDRFNETEKAGVLINSILINSILLHLSCTVAARSSRLGFLGWGW